MGGSGGVRGDLFNAEVKGTAGKDVRGAGVAKAGDEVGVAAKGELHAEEVDVAGRAAGLGGGVRKEEADVADGPGFRQEGDFVEAGGEQGAAGGGEGRGAGAVEHGVDLLGCGHVGGGDGVVADEGDAEVAALRLSAVRAANFRLTDGDGVDGAAGVGLHGTGEGGEVEAETDAVKAADEDFGVGDGTVGAAGVGHAVECEGGGVEVSLGDNAGGVDEVLEVGGAVNGGFVEVGGLADVFDVDVDDGVGFGQETGGFGRGLGAEVGHDAEGGEDGEDDEEREGCAFAHRVVGCWLLVLGSRW